MGPDFEGIGSADVPRRPKFSWDIKSGPWTDGKGDQEDYVRSVKLWSAFHDKLPDSNANKIPADLRGIMLQSHLYGRAKDLCKKIPDEMIQSAGGLQEIVNTIHKRDPLSAVGSVYQDFVSVMNTKRGNTESFRNFESRFSATVSKFNAHASSCVLPESLMAFMLLANSALDTTQRVSVLAAASPSEVQSSDATTTEDYLKAVSYESVATVLRQCDKSKGEAESLQRTVIANSSASISQLRYRPKRNTLTPEQLADLKSKSKCHKCGQKGHWK